MESPQEDLVGQLKDNDAFTRSRALRLLGMQRAPRYTGLFIELLKDKSPEVATNAREALILIGPAAVPEIRKSFPAFAGAEILLISPLGAIGDETAAATLGDLFRKSDRLIQKSVLEALLPMGVPAVPTMVDLLKNWTGSFTSKEFQSLALELGKIDRSQALALLTALFNGKRNEQRAGVAEALGHIGDPRAMKILKPALKDVSLTVRLSVLSALGNLDDASAISALLKMRLPPFSLSNLVLAELLKIEKRIAVPIVLKHSKDPDRFVRRNVIDLLDAYLDPAFTSVFVEALDDLDFGVRDMAIGALSRLRTVSDERAVAPLIHIIETSNNDFVRMNAIKILGMIGNPKAVPALIVIAAGRHRDMFLREAAIIALGDIGDLRGFPVVEKIFMDFKEDHQLIDAAEGSRRQIMTKNP